MQAHVSTHGVDASYILNGATLREAAVDTAPECGGFVPGLYSHRLRIILTAAAHADRRIQPAADHDEPDRRSDAANRVHGLPAARRGNGWCSRRRVREPLEALYGHALFYVLASRVEGLPITVCEAMAHGKALMLSDIPENVEVGGAAAKYFRCGDVNALLRTMGELAEDAQARMALGVEARRRSEQIYNWDLVTDQIEALYYRTLDL
jgi:glycosyltransferase involved in cell wall biosynthesis